MEIGASVLFTCILELLAGLGLFLYGMNTMSDGLERVAGKQLKGLLGAVTKNRATQVVLGFIITVLMQSSSATTVMMVGLSTPASCSSPRRSASSWARISAPR